jgi:ATP-dependent DNA ligase
MGYEGIMAKRIDSSYLLGKRSDSWLKMKPQKSAICHVIGYTKGEGYRNLLGALVIAQHRENRLIDRGRVGSRISMKTIGDLHCPLSGMIQLSQPSPKVLYLYKHN